MEKKYKVVIRAETDEIEMIPTDDKPFEERELQNEVGGYIETVPTCIEGMLLIVNEESKLLDLKPNSFATDILAPHIDDAIFGDAVLVKAVAGKLEPITWDEFKQIWEA